MENNISFADCGLDDALLKSILNVGFENTTPIQGLTLKPILEGSDIFAQAETGSGKTGAFAIPIIEQMIRNKKLDSTDILYVVLSPTRELAQQTSKVFDLFGKDLNIKCACVIGGENIETQKKLINNGAQILIATPGRLKDLIKQKVADLSNVAGVVFDEADRLFDMGFQKDIEFILNKIPTTRQLIMVSATSNMEVLHTAYKFKSTPIELKLNADSLLVDNINHALAMVSTEEKMPLLVKLLREKDDYTIIFCNTQLQTHLVAQWLMDMGFKAKAISGRLAQNKRTKLMDEFRNKEIMILVCTDVAARGLDIKDVTFVVNYDIPQDAANYVHRIGRTGRAGKEGRAISFAAYEDCEYLDPIYKLIEDKIPKMDLEDSDFATDVTKKPYLDYKTLKVREDRPDRKRNKPEKKKHESPKKVAKSLPQPTKKIETPIKKESDKMTTTSTTNAPKAKRVDKRFFEITTRNKKDADTQAMKFLGINDAELLDQKIISLGSKMFIFFGPSKITYKYFVKPMYKKLLLPFLIEVIKKSGLKLYAKVHFNAPVLNISITGNDEELLKANRGELTMAIEHLSKQFLNKKIALPRELRISINNTKSTTENTSDRPNRNRNDRGGKPERKNSEKWLNELVDKTKKQVLELNDTVTLKALNPADRRIIHQAINEDSKFKSTSLGDGRFKKIEISLN